MQEDDRALAQAAEQLDMDTHSGVSPLKSKYGTLVGGVGKRTFGNQSIKFQMSGDQVNQSQSHH